MREVLPRVGLKFKTSQCTRNRSPTKFLQIYLRLTRIGCPTLCPKRDEVEIHVVINLLVRNMVVSEGVNALWEREFIMVWKICPQG